MPPTNKEESSRQMMNPVKGQGQIFSQEARAFATEAEVVRLGFDTEQDDQQKELSKDEVKTTLTDLGAGVPGNTDIGEKRR